MSTERDEITSPVNEHISVTSFFGGEERGRCIQLTQSTVRAERYIGFGTIQLTEDQAAILALDILDWLDADVDALNAALKKEVNND